MTPRELWTEMKASGFDEKKCLKAIEEYGSQCKDTGYNEGYQDHASSYEFHDEY